MARLLQKVSGALWLLKRGRRGLILSGSRSSGPSVLRFQNKQGLRGQMEAIGSLNEVVGDLNSSIGTVGGQIQQTGPSWPKQMRFRIALSFVVYSYVRR